MRGSGVLRSNLPRGLSQYVGEAEARVLHGWLGLWTHNGLALGHF